MSKAKLGANNPNFAKSLSEEGRLKLSSIRGSAVEVYDIDIKERSYYSSLSKAATALSCGRATLQRYIISKELFRGKYIITEILNKDKDGGGDQPLNKTFSTEGEDIILVDEKDSSEGDLLRMDRRYVCGWYSGIAYRPTGPWQRKDHITFRVKTTNLLNLAYSHTP